MPTPQNIQQLILGVAKHKFLVKLRESCMQFVRECLKSTMRFGLYIALNATPAAVLGKITEPGELNSAESRVFGYLTRFIGNMKQEELCCVLRFVTGSSVLIDKAITVSFNPLYPDGHYSGHHATSVNYEWPL